MSETSEKAELKLVPHSLLSHARVVEVWWGGKMVCIVVGADGPGVRIISKHVTVDNPSVSVEPTTGVLSPGVVEVIFEKA